MIIMQGCSLGTFPGAAAKTFRGCSYTPNGGLHCIQHFWPIFKYFVLWVGAALPLCLPLTTPMWCRSKFHFIADVHALKDKRICLMEISGTNQKSVKAGIKIGSVILPCQHGKDYHALDKRKLKDLQKVSLRCCIIMPWIQNVELQRFNSRSLTFMSCVYADMVLWVHIPHALQSGVRT